MNVSTSIQRLVRRIEKGIERLRRAWPLERHIHELLNAGWWRRAIRRVFGSWRGLSAVRRVPEPSRNEARVIRLKPRTTTPDLPEAA